MIFDEWFVVCLVPSCLKIDVGALRVLIERPSPNFDDRPTGVSPGMLVLHYTGMESCEAALARLCDPAAKVSAHYVINEDGAVYRLVDEASRAWHAGEACWRGVRDVNGHSIGVELVNPGHELGYRAFPEAQMAALVELAAAIVARHAIPAMDVVGHADVAPARRRDPGELFDWRRLAAAGIGLWTGEAVGASEAAGSDITVLQEKLGRLGYGIDVSGIYDAATESVLTALQRHFRQSRVDGLADRETLAVLDDLLRQTG